MRILIQPPDHVSGARRVDEEVSKALEVLRDAFIKTEGGGTVSAGSIVAGDGAVTGVIVISSRDDASKALDALAKAGIRAALG